MVQHTSEQSLLRVPPEERHLYLDRDVFGKLGGRRFVSHVMDSPHWHGHVEVNYLDGGALTYDIDGVEIEVEDGQLIAFWAGIPHRLSGVRNTGETPTEQANIYIPADAFLEMPHIAEMQVALMSGAVIAVRSDLCDRRTVARWLEDCKVGDFERQEILKVEVNALFRRATLAEIDYLKPPGAQGRSGRVSNTTHIEHVVGMLRYILDNLTEPITNADVTSVTGLHENYALTLFSRSMHTPPKRFITRMRLLRARSMLIDSSGAISVIAAESGFSSVTQFYHHFQAAYGLSPNAFRLEHR